MNKQAEAASASDKVDGFIDTQAKKKVEELLRYILTRFLSVSVNIVFKQCCEAGEEAEAADKPDGRILGEPLTSLELLTKYGDNLPVIFTACGKHIAVHHLDITKKLFFHILPNLGLPDGQLEGVNIDQIISKCIAEWFLSCFQVSLVDLFPSEEVIQAIEQSIPNLSDVIRVTFLSKYLDSLLEVKAEERENAEPRVFKVHEWRRGYQGDFERFDRVQNCKDNQE